MENRKELPIKWEELASAIPNGNENAITLDKLMDRVGISNRRTTQEILEQLILKHGYVILANKQHPRGYYMPLNDSEFNNGINPIKETARSFNDRVNALYHNYYKQ